MFTVMIGVLLGFWIYKGFYTQVTAGSVEKKVLNLKQVVCTRSVASKVGTTEQSKKMNVAFVIAPKNFRDEEFYIPFKYFKEHGWCCNVFSISRECRGMLGLLVKGVLPLETLKERIDEFDLVYFAGGSGILKIYNDKAYVNIAKLAYQKGKNIAAICLAPMILAEAGVIVGKKATVFACKDSLSLLEDKQVEYVGEKIVFFTTQKGAKVFTAPGPKYAKEFAQFILRELQR